MNKLTPPSQEEQHQLAHPTFPVMQQLKASAKGHTVFSAKGILDYDKLDISEFAFAFLEFIQQQPQLHHKNLFRFLQLLMQKAMNYLWSSVKNFNLSINQAFAQGRLTRGQMDVIQAWSNNFFSHANLRSRQNTSLLVYTNKATTPEESRKIRNILTGIIQRNALVISLTWSTRTPITTKCVILTSILCSIVVNGDISFLPTGLHNQSHND